MGGCCLSKQGDHQGRKHPDENTTAFDLFNPRQTIVLLKSIFNFMYGCLPPFSLKITMLFENEEIRDVHR